MNLQESAKCLECPAFKWICVTRVLNYKIKRVNKVTKYYTYRFHLLHYRFHCSNRILSLRFFLVAQHFRTAFRSMVSVKSFSVERTIKSSSRSPVIDDRKKFLTIFILLNDLSMSATLTGLVPLAKSLKIIHNYWMRLRRISRNIIQYIVIFF